MASQSKLDQFANFAVVPVTESAAATQTSVKFNFPFSIMDRVALLISRIEYWIPNFVAMNTAQDIVYSALTASASVPNIANQADPLIIDIMSVTRTDMGTAASGILTVAPIIKDFANLPGGGLLVSPSPLYGMVQGVGTTPAMLVYIKLFYTYMELKTEEYWQLVESRRIIST
jgi:hypothetical protein